MSKTIGIFGGAFDPVHIAHSKLVIDIKNIIYFEKIFVVPSGNPVFKDSHFCLLYTSPSQRDVEE